MKFSLSWLKAHLETDATIQDVADCLNRIGLEVEGIENPAERLAGSTDIFCAFATDGVDGGSGAAGASVDGSTIDRGDDPLDALRSFDSAGYLAGTSDLLRCPPTGTNVSDLWILWRRG